MKILKCLSSLVSGWMSGINERKARIIAVRVRQSDGTVRLVVMDGERKVAFQ